mmetsp:Transcript_123409/g.384070  ORF Transcript_123409/g.384070 Transcript_123409/m.384070 type:complete len:153 (+) Transcript_123409:76-534(+)
MPAVRGGRRRRSQWALAAALLFSGAALAFCPGQTRRARRQHRPSRPAATSRRATPEWTFGPKSYSGEGEVVSSAATQDEAVPGLWGWLKHLGLEHHWQSVDAWCAEAGAAELQEVVDSVEELAEELPLEAAEVETLRRRARLALSAVNGFQL